jgi:membrane-bound serine protease (ClpP class)
MAAHVAVMAPATNIGAAHPVAIGAGQADQESLRKLTNDTAAFARTIAAARGRNAEWAERAVRESVSITEREAVALNVVDLVAESVPDLLAKVDGRRVTTARGPVTLQTRDAAVQPIEIGLRDRVLAVITDPNVAYLLMMAGMLGLFFELANPGALVPGIVGGISLILAFFAFQSLPINYAGLLLILFGLLLFVAEVKVASHGALAVGGTIALALGSLMLYDAPELGFRVAWPVVIVTVGLTALLVAGVLALGLRALRRRPALEAAGLLGRTAVALEALAPEGQVTIQGETWRAVADGFVPAGGRVTVTAVAGLTLRVAKTDGGGEEGT